MGGEGAPERKDLMNALITSVDEDGKGMSNQALRDEMMTLLVAGQETSAILLGWTAALLAHNPEVQERAAQERLTPRSLRQAIDVCLCRAVASCPTDAAPSTCALPWPNVRAMKLQYTEAVILEALRMYAPAYMVGRCACEDVMLGEYKLAKGTTVLIRRIRENYRRSSASTLSNPVQDTNAGVQCPLGEPGPRNCIGTGFAMMEGITVLAALLQKYKLVTNKAHT
eukprot:gene2069-18253_t